LPGTISGSCSASLEPNPDSKIYRTLSSARLSLGPAWQSRHHISLTAVLEFGPTEILPPIGAISKPLASLPTRSPSHQPRPARKAGFSTFENDCGRETDCLLEGDGFELPVPEGKTGQTAQTTLHPILVRGPSSGVARLAAGGTRFEPLGPRREWRVPCPLISRHEWILSAVRATFSIAGNQRETRVTSP
jgi:hypothetical protein